MVLVNLVYMNDSPTLYPQISMGLGNISACLKSKGHDVVLFDTYYDPDDFIVKKIKKYKPRLIGISTTEIHSKHAFEIAQKIKDVINIPIIFGGVFPTICPDECLNNKNVDMVLVGEGEHALNDLLSYNFAGRVCGVWRKNNGSIERNGTAIVPQVENLPWVDYSIFRKNSITPVGNFGDGPKSRFFIWTGRGCAYDCSYCCNSLLKKVLGNKIRYREINDVIEEMKILANNYNFDEFFFTDENFLYDYERVREFCNDYVESGINKPFGFLSRPDMINHSNENIIRLLQKSRCIRIHMGIETGNEHLRMKYLNRNISDDEIIEAFKLCKKYKIKTGSFNIIGFPFETMEDIQKTYDLNVKCEADYVCFSLFYPFKGTVLRDFCEKEDYLLSKSKEIKSYFDGTIIKCDYISQKNIVKLIEYLQKNYPKTIKLKDYSFYLG